MSTNYDIKHSIIYACKKHGTELQLAIDLNLAIMNDLGWLDDIEDRSGEEQEQIEIMWLDYDNSDTLNMPTPLVPLVDIDQVWATRTGTYQYKTISVGVLEDVPAEYNNTPCVTYQCITSGYNYTRTVDSFVDTFSRIS